MRNYPSDKMLAEIAVKNLLLQLSKRAQELAFYKDIQEKYNFGINPEELFQIHKLDERDYSEDFIYHKNIVEKDVRGGYQVLFWKLLPYTVPIAMQSAVALTKDMEGNVINDVFDMSTEVRIQLLHIAILPLNGASVVLAFYHKRDKLYKRLLHQFNSSSVTQCLSFLNHLIFEYTENYFISPCIRQAIMDNDNLVKLSQDNNGFPNLGFISTYEMLNNCYKSVGVDDIPNLLLEEWKVV